jgi:hypothetical protein
MRKRWKIILLITTLVLLVCAWFFWPSPSFDRALVHPKLRSLKEPYRSVVTKYYLDGGSVGIRITDHDGQVLEFALPASGIPQRYDRVFMGGMYFNPRTTNTLVEVQNPVETKKMLIRTIEKYSAHGPDTDGALIYLRGLPRDHVMPLVREQLGR